MTNREFVTLLKKQTSDSAGELTLSSLVRNSPLMPTSARNLALRAWTSSLAPDARLFLEELMKDAAETAILSALCLLDGVSAGTRGVFEIYEVIEGEPTTVINPENTEMLHDLYSDLIYGDEG